MADAKEGLATSDNVSLTLIEATKVGSKTTLNASLTFEDARQATSILQSFRNPLDLTKKSDEEILFGDVDLQVSFPQIIYSRDLDIRSLVPPEGNNPMTTRLLGDSKISYRLHLPTPAKTHNADQVSNHGRSLEWNMPLTELLAGPVEMKFTAPIPRLSLYLTLLGLLLLLVIAFLAQFIKRRQTLSTTPA